MSGQVQELIDKIKNEGVQSAEQQAAEIKKNAETEAEQIKVKAREEADRILLDAKNEAKKTRESAEVALKQASRDTLLSLKKSIQGFLHEIIAKEVKDSLTSEQVGTILVQIVDNIATGKDQSIEIVLSDADKNKLKDGALAKLQKKLKDGFTIKSSGQITKGFAISFDGGKSSFEFTEESLAEYISTFLNDQLASLIKG
ncbi:MAG: hypothetical protein KC684_02565 [Candidatus Omnitrophica bacterium]|nr:hypothetical protein [Candidatus Omnitrophota bacterium]